MLLLLIVLISLFPYFYGLFVREKPAASPTLSWVDDNNNVKDAPAVFEADAGQVLEKNGSSSGKATEGESTLFYFDPNNLPAEKWRALGFSDKQISVIKNYEAKGGKFYDAKDVAKMYSISDRAFQRIAPYLQFPEREVRGNNGLARREQLRERKTAYLVNLDVNVADSISFQALHGIGPVLSARIVKFRDRLGGFHSVDQLLEVYGLPVETFEQIKGQLSIDKAAVHQLPINRVSAEELAAHPYCSRKMAQIIIRYRDQHGQFNSLSDLNNIYVLDADFLRKIEPYLNFN